jgi:hypothetical protein
LAKGLIDKLSDIYTPDVVGHFQDGEFYYQDIMDRVQALHDSYQHFQMSIKDLKVIDDLIVFNARQVWLSSLNNNLCESILVGVYRMRENHVCELWIMTDQPMDKYEGVSRNI